MEKRWIFNESGNNELVNELASSLGVDEFISSLLIQRGITDYEEAEAFFRPNLNDLHNPFLMKDMDKAVERISYAIENKQKVLIYGDYDVDGTTSVSLIYKFLKDKLHYIDYYIPDRYSEGYGISYKGIDYAKEKSISLIIALDCGIKAVDKIAYANKLGVDFIICDHHTPGEQIPDAIAVLDPKRENCEYPCKDLSGCGVGFKLMQACVDKLNFSEEELFSLLDYVAVSIASDIVPIVGENRILSFHGLKKLNENPNLAFKILKQLSGVKNTLSVTDIVFKIGPRINAAGRMQTGRYAVQFLTASDEGTAKILGATLDKLNEKRKELDKEITDSALEKVANSKENLAMKSTVLYDANWHKGVIGIVASRLIETYYKPTVILTESNGLATGSARSVAGFNLYDAVDSCADLLESYGGHKYAAGLSLKVENVAEFKRRFENYVSENISEDMLVPQIKIDTRMPLSSISAKFFRIIQQFQPFGPQNMTPIFVSENVVDYGQTRIVGKNRDHLRLSVVDDIRDSNAMTGIAFSLAGKYNSISKGSSFDICYSLQKNEYMGREETQLLVRDIKLHSHT